MDMSTSNNPTKKITRGRQKIEIKKIEKKQNRQVTFTKRRNGVFKKAAELCILTGADVAVFVKSHSGRIWTFGHPNVESVVDRYFSGSGGGGGSSLSEEVNIKEFNRIYDDVGKDLEAEKRNKVLIESGVANINDRFWWEEEPIEGLGLDQLEFYVAALEELKNKVSIRTDQMMRISTPNSMHYYSSPMLAINPINSENSSELACNHYVNQPHDFASTSSFVPSIYDFGYGEQLN